MNRLELTRSIPLIAIGYRKGSGKDTIADYLVRTHRFHKASFAGVLKRVAQTITGFSHAQVDGDKKEETDAFWSFSPRWFLQRLGTEVGRAIDPDLWVKALGRELSHFDRTENEFTGSQFPGGVVISDMRFPNEMQAVRDWGGVTVEVFRPSAYETEGGHVSETALRGAAFDMVVPNVGSLDDLFSRAETMLVRAKSNEFQRTQP